MRRSPLHLATIHLLRPPPQLPPPPSLHPQLRLLRQEACRPVPEWRHVAALTDWMLPPQVSRLKVIEERAPEMAVPQTAKVRFRGKEATHLWTDEVVPMEMLPSNP